MSDASIGVNGGAVTSNSVPSTTVPMLSVSGVVKHFGGIVALNSVTIAVNGGEVVALIGPNGSGKTTLLSMLLGLQRPDSGSITLAGHTITTAAANSHIRRAVAATFQTPQLIESLTVAENLRFAARLKHFPGGRHGLDDRIVECLTGLTLGAVLHHPARSLSGGQRKLVELGRALIVQPDLLLLDEPTAGVAPSLATVIGEHIADARSRGVAVLLVSHNLPWTFSLCDRVSVMAEGEVIASGSADEIQKDPRVIAAYLH